MTVLWQAYRRVVETLYRLRHRVHAAVIQYIAAGGEAPMPPPRPSPHPPNAHEPVSHAQLNDRLSHYVTESELNRRLAHIERHIRALEQVQTIQGEKIVASQADIDALTAALAQEDSDLNTAVTAIQAEIVALQQANPALDLTALSAQVDATAAAVAAAAALVPAPPAG